MKDFLNLVEDRFTCKAYDPNRTIPKKEIEQLAEIIRLSPSSSNMQPWHFIVTGNSETKNKIAEYARDFNIDRIKKASHVFILCGVYPFTKAYFDKVVEQIKHDWPTYRGMDDYYKKAHLQYVGSDPVWQHEFVTNQVHIAMHQLLLGAAALGIDATPMGGFDEEKLDKAFNLKEKGLISVLLVSLGYRDENNSHYRAGDKKSRLPKDEVFTFLD